MSRYAEKAGKSPACPNFLQRLSSIICDDPSSPIVRVSGEEKFRMISLLIDEVSEVEDRMQLSDAKRITTTALKHVHLNQRKFFEKNFPPVGYKQHLTDRTGRTILLRGTAGVESLWRNMRASMPEHFGVQFGESKLLALATTWNFKRMQMFDSR